MLRYRTLSGPAARSSAVRCRPRLLSSGQRPKHTTAFDMPGFEEKSAIAVPFIIDRIKAHRAKHDRPFFLGVNGVQGAGKTTLVTSLQETLSAPPHSLPTATFSIDDLYLSHADQAQLAASHPANPLVQHRGQPGTHDVALAQALFASLRRREPDVRIPSYDKAAFGGEGDRRPAAEWAVANAPGAAQVQVVLFEGWCVGFRPLADAELERRWRAAAQAADDARARGEWTGRLGLQRLQDVRFVNEQLRRYDCLTDYFDAFIHIDAEDTRYVYDWRLEAESRMRAEKGSGMSDEQVLNFVDGYYPAYELFTDTLRDGIFSAEAKGQQLRLVVGKDRSVVHSEVI